MLRQVQAQRVCLGEEIARMLFAEMWVLAGGSLAVQFFGMRMGLKLVRRR